MLPAVTKVKNPEAVQDFLLLVTLPGIDLYEVRTGLIFSRSTASRKCNRPFDSRTRAKQFARLGSWRQKNPQQCGFVLYAMTLPGIEPGFAP